MTSSSLRVVGRYQIGPAIGSGGMATVHLGRLFASAGFSRTVAIKQLRPVHSADAELSAMLLDEARLASRIRHPNVVAPLDVVVVQDETFIVMEYVHGESLSGVIRLLGGTPVPPAIAAAIMGQVLLGLHAAHRATSEDGQPLALVHRDVSPQNIMLTPDGVARLVDFGVAKTQTSVHVTERGFLKGKLGYIAPEQVAMEPVDRRTDLFAAGVVLWEMLTGQRLFLADTVEGSIDKLSKLEVLPPSQLVPGPTPALDHVVKKSLARDPADRFADAHEMAVALASAAEAASPLELGAWINEVASEVLAQRVEKLADFEARPLSELTVDLPIARPGAAAPRTPPAGGIELDSSSRSLARAGAHPSPQGRRGRAEMTTAIALALAALGIATLSLMRQRERDDTRLAVQPLTTSSEPAPPPPQVAPPFEGALAASTDGESHVPAATPSQEPRPSKAIRTRSGGAPREKPQRPCTIPYSIDKKGVKRFNAECF
jgi:serine/threonine protein kinase